jgi:hypothetical protein
LRQERFVQNKVDQLFFVPVLRELRWWSDDDGVIGGDVGNVVALVSIFRKFINSFLSIFLVDDWVENGLSQRHPIVNYVFGHQIIYQFHFRGHLKCVDQI